jgi:dihydroxy-acid dehydratase
VVVAATGGSTNGALHLPAMAHECGIAFTLRDVAEIAARTPYIADLKPGRAASSPRTWARRAACPCC